MQVHLIAREHDCAHVNVCFVRLNYVCMLSLVIKINFMKRESNYGGYGGLVFASFLIGQNKRTEE